MYFIYIQVCQALGYEIVFNQFEIESNNLELDELVGFMANIDELDSFSDEIKPIDYTSHT